MSQRKEAERTADFALDKLQEALENVNMMSKDNPAYPKLALQAVKLSQVLVEADTKRISFMENGPEKEEALKRLEKRSAFAEKTARRFPEVDVGGIKAKSGGLLREVDEQRMREQKSISEVATALATAAGLDPSQSGVEGVRTPKEFSEWFEKNKTHLTGLKTLDLSSLNLVSLPKEIGQLENLTELRLYNFKGNDFPSAIYELKNLQNLYLQGSAITNFQKDNLEKLPLKNLILPNKTMYDELSQGFKDKLGKKCQWGPMSGEESKAWQAMWEAKGVGFGAKSS